MYFLFQGRTPEELIPSSKQQLFNKLKTAVTKDLLHKAKASAPKRSDDGKRWENRFAILRDLEEHDCQDDDK